MYWVVMVLSLLFFTSCTTQNIQETEDTVNIPQEQQEIVIKSESGNTWNISSEDDLIIQEEVVEKSIPEYLQITKDWDNLVFERVLSETASYTRYQISYTSEWFKISGIMNIPKNVENAPLLILNHGYIDPAVYTLWRWLKREQDYFANNGFAVLHTDYRNHAFSDTDTSLEGTGSVLRSKKYWADAINAILAVQKAKQSWAIEVQSLDTESVGMLWHSMWWWVTMYGLVAQPNLIDAAVLYAPVHSQEFYNYQRWIQNRMSPENKQELNTIYGNTESPESFSSISSETYFSNIQSPLQMYFGTNDESCPIAWGYHIEKALTDAEKSIDFIVYDGEKHEFWPQWQNFMQGSAEFFRKELTNK